MMALEALPFALSPGLERALREAYTTPVRAYHHFGHVEEVLGHYATVPHWQEPRSVAWAVLFHDAVYVPGQGDNELRSAVLARELFEREAPQPGFNIERATQLILLTRDHGSVRASEVELDAAHFLDCDMAILGAEPARFDPYEQAIRSEYAFLSPELYRAGRARFLRKLLASESVYLSAHFRARFELAARANLARALRTLEG